MYSSVKSPALPDVIVYYVTRIIGVPIFVDTDLRWFRTQKFSQWVQSNNLPAFYFEIMEGTLSSEFDIKIPKGICIELSQSQIDEIEIWLKSWRNETRLRKYSASLQNHPELFDN